jgi:hypothetical protein
MARTFMAAGKRVSVGHAAPSAAEPAQLVTQQAPAWDGRRRGDLLATLPISAPPAQREEQGSVQGLPNALRSGIESLSGVRLDAVRVHYNSPAPARLDAGAYAQGTHIHIGPGHEHLLPHEAWHAVQQAQRRVPPGHGGDAEAANRNPELEREADIMGARALGASRRAPDRPASPADGTAAPSAGQPVTQLGGKGGKGGKKKRGKKFNNNEDEFVGAPDPTYDLKSQTDTHVHFFPDGGGHLRVGKAKYAFQDHRTEHLNGAELPAGIAALQKRAITGNFKKGSKQDNTFKETYRILRQHEETRHWFVDQEGDDLDKPAWFE